MKGVERIVFCACIAVCALQAPCAPQAVRAGNAVVCGKARFTLLSDRMARCEWSEDGAFEDRPSLVFVNRSVSPVEFSFEQTAGGVVLKTARMTLEWTGGAFDAGNLFANGVAVLSEDKENLLGTQRTLDRKGSIAAVAAGMEKGLLSRRGVTVVDDTSTPLFAASSGPYGTWVEERPARGPGAYRDLVVFAYGRDYKGCLGDYVKVAGRIPLPPRWAFGYWWSRWWLYTDVEVREFLSMLKASGVPIDVFILDMEWHETWRISDRPDKRDEFGQRWGWTGYTWNRKLFPDPRATLDFLHRNGCKVALNLHPASGIQPVEDCFEAFARDYGWTQTNAVPFRAGDEKWAHSYFRNVIAPLEACGVDFWWLDWQQWRMDRQKPTLSNTFWLNHIFFTCDRRENARPLIYHRWGGLGSHRYQVGFSGDTLISWQALAAIPWFTATASNVGYGYWGHDIGGFRDIGDGMGADGELFTRWMQSAVFTPIFKTHAAKDPKIERRIWKYPDHFAHLREAMRLRYRLAPYIYTAAREAFDTGVSICRPMYYEWPDEDAAYSVTNAYMFGRDILAVTISTPADKASGLAALDIWFPEGKWFDVSAGDIVEGGAVRRREYDIAGNPWFVRAGAVIPMYPDSVDNLANPGTDDLVLLFAPGAEHGECDIYEDAGDNPDYATAFRRTHVARDGARVTIAPRRGAYTLKFPLSAAPLGVTVNGEPCAWSFDPRDFAIVVQTPVQDGARETVVELAMPPDADALAARLCGLKGVQSRMDALMQAFKEGLWTIEECLNPPDSWLAYWQAPAAIAANPADMARILQRREAARRDFFSNDLPRYAGHLPKELVERMKALR